MWISTTNDGKQTCRVAVETFLYGFFYCRQNPHEEYSKENQMNNSFTEWCVRMASISYEPSPYNLYRIITNICFIAKG